MNTTKIFERLGASVLLASRGKEALELLEKHDLDVIFLDVNMLGMNGLETLAVVKKSRLLVGVIMITGNFSREQAPERLRFGAYDFLIKPVNISDLGAKDEEAWNKRKAMVAKLRILL